MFEFDPVAGAARLTEHGPLAVVPPRPRVSKPDRRQQVQFSALRAMVCDTDACQDVFWSILRVFNHDVKIPVFRENAQVNQLKFGAVFIAAPVFFDEL